MQIVPVSEGRTFFYLVLAEFKFCFMGQWEDKLCKHLLRAGKTGFFDSELPCICMYIRVTRIQKVEIHLCIYNGTHLAVSLK